MAEATGLQEVPVETPRPQIPKEARIIPASPWEKWAGHLEAKKGKPLSRSEEKIIDMVTDLGIELPKNPEEVKDPDNERTWQPNKLRDIFLQFSDGFIKRGAMPNPLFIENYIARIQVEVDKGEILPREGDAFVRDLQRLLVEAQDRQERTIIEEAKKIAAQAGTIGEFKKLDIAVQGQFKNLARSQLNLQVNIPPGGAGTPLPPGWAVGPGGVLIPPGGQGGVPPGGQGGQAGAAGQGPQIPMPESEYVEQWLEYQTLKVELRRALGLDPTHPLATQRKAALLTANPDLNDSMFDDLNALVDKLDVSKVHLFNWMSRDITDLKTSQNAPNTPADWEVSEESRKLLFEGMYEKLIGKPDKGSPEIHYKIGSFYVMDLLDRMDNLALEKFDQDYSLYISDLQHVRQVMHELNISLKYGEQYKEFILKELSAAGLHFVYNEVAGVNQVFEAFELVAANKVSRNKEWLSDSDIAQIREEVRTLFNGVPNVFDPVEMEKEGRKLTKGERDRAFRMAEIFFAGIQRRGMYAFMGDLPPMVAGSARIASTDDVYIGRSLMPGKQGLQFFPGYKEEQAFPKEKELTAAEGAREFIREIIKAEKTKIKQDGQELVNLFGLNDATIIFNHYGSYDLISHSWRGPKLFFDPIHYIDNAGNEKTLFERVNELVRQLDPTAGDPVLGAGELNKAAKNTLHLAVKDIVLGQRLYLSTFVRHGNFDGAFKTEIWKKSAILKPSTIATLLPESISDPAVWEGMRLKLFAAELKRVQNDTQLYQQPQTMQSLVNERQNFDAISAVVNNNAAWTAAELAQVLTYIGIQGLNLTAAEQTVLENIIKTGFAKAEKLAKAKMTFTVMVYDAPNISWKPSGRSFGGLSDADNIRLLASDQPTLQEGWNEGFNSLVENPTEGYIEKIKKVVTGYARVHGRDPAVATLRPLGIAWHKMAAMDWKSKWIPGLYAFRKIVDQGSSVMTKYWRASKIEMDEEETKNSVVAVAQAIGASSTESKKMREETGSDVPMMLLFWFRTLMAILPPAMATELVKLMLPKLK